MPSLLLPLLMLLARSLHRVNRWTCDGSAVDVHVAMYGMYPSGRSEHAPLTLLRACFCSGLSSGIAALMKRLAPATSMVSDGLCSCNHFSDSTFATFLL